MRGEKREVGVGRMNEGERDERREEGGEGWKMDARFGERDEGRG